MPNEKMERLVDDVSKRIEEHKRRTHIEIIPLSRSGSEYHVSYFGSYVGVVVEAPSIMGYGRRWNGYIGVPNWHPYFDKDYDEVSLDAHGGLTFSGRFDLASDRWFFGFDHLHGFSGDTGGHDHKREDVMKEVEDLYEQCEKVRKDAGVEPPKTDRFDMVIGVFEAWTSWSCIVGRDCSWAVPS